MGGIPVNLFCGGAVFGTEFHAVLDETCDRLRTVIRRRITDLTTYWHFRSHYFPEADAKLQDQNFLVCPISQGQQVKQAAALARP